MSNKIDIIIEGNFTFSSEGFLTFFIFLTSRAKSRGWEIFDLPISTTGLIKELVGHYCEITLSYINTQAEIINSDNYSIDQ